MNMKRWFDAKLDKELAFAKIDYQVKEQHDAHVKCAMDYYHINTPYKDMFPDGRYIYYEGDDPLECVRLMKELFNFDPSLDNSQWGVHYPVEYCCTDPGEWCEQCPGKCEAFTVYGFDCPADMLEAVYIDHVCGPMGS